MDRRINKTRQALQQALLSLLREQAFERIEIQAITERANTARVTFYRHYGTKEELLLDTLEHFYAEIQAQLGGYSVEAVLDFQQPAPQRILFAFLEKDRALYKRLFVGSTSALIQRRIRQYIVEQVALSFRGLPDYADLPMELIGQQIATVTIGNIMWWLGEDLPYSADYMAHFSHTMSWLGARTLIAPGHPLARLIPDL